jgi:hypothetical protein
MSSFAMNPTSSSTTTIPSILAIPISEKLTKSNYPLWSAQVLSVIWVVQLHDLSDRCQDGASKRNHYGG